MDELPEVNPAPHYNQYYQHVGQKEETPGLETVPVTVANRSKRLVWLLSALLVLVIIAAAVGGGVGGSLAVKNAKKDNSDKVCSNSQNATTTVTKTITATSSSSSTSTSTSSASAATVSNYSPPIAGSLAVDCTKLTGSTQSSVVGSSGYDFSVICNYDYPGNDILSFTSYSFADCMQACAVYNELGGTKDCNTFVFISQILNQSNFYGNCFLKSSNANGAIKSDVPGDTYVAATLN